MDDLSATITVYMMKASLPCTHVLHCRVEAGDGRGRNSGSSHSIYCRGLAQGYGEDTKDNVLLKKYKVLQHTF
jgi:hypothetical protein